MHKVSALFALFLLCVPRITSANQIVAARFSLSTSDANVIVVGRDELRVERVRSEPGTLLVWFSGIDADARIDVDVREAGIRHVKVRPSVVGVSVVRIGLVDGRSVSSDAVRIDIRGNEAVISIARSALMPVLTVQTPPAPVVAVASGPLPSSPAAVGTVPSAAATMAPSVAPRPSPSTQEILASSPRRAERPGPAFPILLLITGLLAVALLVVRLVTQRIGVHPALKGIEIVSQKRLGARHQLIVVRALGRDHLLSMHGDQLRKIGSAAIGEALDESAADSGPAGVLDRIRQRLGRVDADARREAARGPVSRDIAIPRLRSAREFDMELAKAEEEAHRQRAPRAQQRPSQTRAEAESSSIATLLELRRQAGK